MSAGEFLEFMNRLERARRDLRQAADMIAKAQAQLAVLEVLGRKLQVVLEREGIS